MKVKIHNLDKEITSYTAVTESNCQDTTDKAVYRLVLQFRDTITMGSVIGHPDDG